MPALMAILLTASMSALEVKRASSELKVNVSLTRSGSKIMLWF